MKFSEILEKPDAKYNFYKINDSIGQVLDLEDNEYKILTIKNKILNVDYIEEDLDVKEVNVDFLELDEFMDLESFYKNRLENWLYKIKLLGFCEVSKTIDNYPTVCSQNFYFKSHGKYYEFSFYKDVEYDYASYDSQLATFRTYDSIDEIEFPHSSLSEMITVNFFEYNNDINLITSDLTSKNIPAYINGSDLYQLTMYKDQYILYNIDNVMFIASSPNDTTYGFNGSKFNRVEAKDFLKKCFNDEIASKYVKEEEKIKDDFWCIK